MSVSLSALLTRPLLSFGSEFDHRRADGALPSLPVLSNVLRVLDDGALDLRDLPRRACISRRAVRDALKHATRDGWVQVDDVPGVRGRKDVSATAKGASGLASGRELIRAIEGDWDNSFGERLAGLRSASSALVSALELELPHYPSSYGYTDVGVTGGMYVDGDAGPPRIPPHGEEWPVVLRDRATRTDSLSTPALLSQALTAFAIDYEARARGYLTAVANCLRFIGDDGVRLGSIGTGPDLSGNGKALLERHRFVVVEPGRPKADRIVRLTERGAKQRDSYESVLADVEKDWRIRYGDTTVSALRAALEDLDGEWDPALPQFPLIFAWLRGVGS